jgi:hypothetical protein
MVTDKSGPAKGTALGFTSSLWKEQVRVNDSIQNTPTEKTMGLMNKQ